MTDEGTSQYEVRVVDAYKSYGKVNVLNGLHLNVASGCIYGLLGPSGCGKSTLLQCILGSMTLDSGQIDLRANSITDLGYMPQDLCLEPTLTLDETFGYYGSLYTMSRKKIEQRKDELRAFLQLPDMSYFVRDLSGGQSRRVSLAVSLLHDPSVIILDEPTVGIDTVLRHEIWNQFVYMVKEHKKTIIITTHYIEEASQADCIGLMRNGVIVEEESPQNILWKHKTDSLESAFLTLCFNQGKSEGAVKPRPAKVAKHTNTMKSETKFDLNRVKVLIKKNVRMVLRDYWLMFIIMLLPTLQSCMVCTCLGGSLKNLKVAVTNEEIEAAGCQYSSNARGCVYDRNNSQALSCDVTSYIESHDYSLIHVKDLEVAKTLMNARDVVAYVYFPKNYTRSLVTFIENRTNYQPEAYAYFSVNDFLSKNQIESVLRSAMDDLKEKIMNDCSMNPKTIRLPINIEVLLGKDVKINTQNMVGIFIIMGTFYYSSIYTVTQMMAEKMDGFLSRSMIAGVTILELVISMFCVNNLVVVAQTIVPLFITYIIFPNPIHITSGLFMCVLVLLLLGWLGFLFGLLAAGITPTKAGGVHIMNGWAITQMLIAGGLWPLEGQAFYLRAVTQFLPMNLGGNVVNSVTLRGWAWNHPAVLKSISIICTHVVLLLFVLIVLGKVKKNAWILNK